MHRFYRALLLAAMAIAVGAEAKICAIDKVPAATLLVPYISHQMDICGAVFETDRATVLIDNVSSQPSLARVTVWSNLGVPVLATTVSMAGQSSAEFAFGDLLCTGSVPDFGLTLNASEREALVADLTGQASPVDGQCAAISRDGTLAEAYITIDHLDNETSLTPADSGYYDAGILSRGNVLTGSYFLIDPANNFAEGFPAVHIEAVAIGNNLFGAGDTTFYGRYNGTSAADGREPLPTTFRVSFDAGSDHEGSRIQVWRETDASAARVACTAAPGWYPLEHSNATGQGPGINGLLLVDEDGHSDFVMPDDIFPVATQAVAIRKVHRLPARSDIAPDLPSRLTRGWLRLNLQHGASAYGAGHYGQAWVTGLATSAGRYQVALPAMPVDAGCDAGIAVIVGTSGRAN